jgi:hypothetical protein
MLRARAANVTRGRRRFANTPPRRQRSAMTKQTHQQVRLKEGAVAIDLDTARKFLQGLGAKNGTFQAFDDNPERNDHRISSMSIQPIWSLATMEMLDVVSLRNSRAQ